MKFLSPLSSIFNLSSSKTVTLSRRQLADIVAPLMPQKAAITNASVAKGWQETAEWLRIGFDAESHKGSLYHALHTSMRQIAQAIKDTPEENITVEIDKSWLRAIKPSYCQAA